MSLFRTALTGTVTHTRLWLAGFVDALKFHRCVIFFVHDSNILVKTVNCFLLNGVIFLGSVLVLEYVLAPVLQLLLFPLLGASVAKTLGLALVGAYHLLWLLPAYAISFLVNCIWYNEIAELVVAAAQRRLLQQRAQREGVVLPAPERAVKVSRPDLLTFLSQEVYRLLLTGALLLQIMLAGWLPGIGQLLGFVGMSWLYALYCFDYKWSLHSVPLEPRLRFFEQHWSYFAGFGAVAVLPLLLGSFYKGAAIVGVLFPVFIMTATDASPKQRFDQVMATIPHPQRPVRMPIFWAASRMANALLARLAGLSKLAVRLGGRAEGDRGQLGRRQQQQQGQQEGGGSSSRSVRQH